MRHEAGFERTRIGVERALLLGGTLGLEALDRQAEPQRFQLPGQAAGEVGTLETVEYRSLHACNHL
jgi:hypothetical protein